MIRKITAKLQKAHFQYRAEKEQKLLDSFVTIHGEHIKKSTYDQIKNSQKVVYNHVIQHGVGVDIYDAKTAIESGCASKRHSNQNLTDKLLVKVTNLLNGMSDEKLISAKTNETHKHTTEKRIFFNIPSEDLQYSRKVTSTWEDNFLRHFYRNIEEMTKKITK